MRAALVSPDFYLAARGERSVHRYCLGRGDVGREKFEQLIEFIEAMQAHYVEPDTGRVLTCSQHRHNFVDFNCSDFVLALERLVINELGGELIRIDEHTPLAGAADKRVLMLAENEPPVPGDSARNRVPRAHRSFAENVWVWLKLCVLDFALMVILTVATIMGKGTEITDNRMFRARKEAQNVVEHFWHATTDAYNKVVRKFSPMQLPMRVRYNQLYHPRLRNHSRQLFHDT